LKWWFTIWLGVLYPIDSVKSRDDYSYFDYKLEIGVYVDADKANPTYLVG